MSRLFVDCDDTLVLWNYKGTPDGLYYADGYQLNRRLMSLVRRWVTFYHPDTALVVWSSGGCLYAKNWSNLCFPFMDLTSADKDSCLALAREGDIYIDDMKLPIPARWVKPVRK